MHQINTCIVLLASFGLITVRIVMNHNVLIQIGAFKS